jgi:hypothetical protein
MSAVSDALQGLLKRIQPTGGEMQAADRHFATIKTRLETVFTMKKFPKAGSFSRATYIRGRSDVDVFAQIALDEIWWGNEWKSSYTMLDKFRKEIATRLPNTRVGRDVHAVVVEFSDMDIDVVPAGWGGFSKEYKRPLYYIPDGNGRWMLTSPEIHNGYIALKNQESGGKLRAVAQLFKFWRVCRDPAIPISSFHIEMVLASEGICNGVKSYAECVTELLQKMAERDCAGIRDPYGISGNIPATKTDAQRATAVASVKNSREHAKAALYAERNGKVDEALRQWDYVFNYRLFR